MDCLSNKSVDIIPNWLFKRYIYIWIRFKDKSFTVLDVKKEFKKTTNQSLNELSRRGWLNRDTSSSGISFIALPPQEILECIFFNSFIIKKS